MVALSGQLGTAWWLANDGWPLELETKLREVERFKITDDGEGPFTRVKVVVAISSRFHRHSKIPDTLQNNDHNNLSVCRGPSFPALLRTRQQQ